MSEPTSSTPPAKKRRKWPWIVAGALVFFWVVGVLAGGDDKDKSTEATSTTTSTTTAASSPASPPPAEPSPTEQAAPVETSPAGPPPGPSIFTGEHVNVHVEPGTAGDVVFAEFNIHDGFTKGMIASNAQRDTVDILKWAHEAYPQASKVVVQGRFPMKDAYGNTANDIILNVSYDAVTLGKINYDDIDTDRIWDIRDGGTVHPELQQE
ncbi:hypothetical protein [Mycolicibacterium mageritense]|uniref:hypothetical protein n=1 Tax=Mycolicibacterium mageritense TaxID=53462 RepID=UPI001E2F71CA|nr:hypothetical protein [Mycolicibacterium mageritense]